MRILLAGVFMFCGVAAAEAQSIDLGSFFPRGGGRNADIARSFAGNFVRGA